MEKQQWYVMAIFVFLNSAHWQGLVWIAFNAGPDSTQEYFDWLPQSTGHPKGYVLGDGATLNATLALLLTRNWGPIMCRCTHARTAPHARTHARTHPCHVITRTTWQRARAPAPMVGQPPAI